MTLQFFRAVGCDRRTDIPKTLIHAQHRFHGRQRLEGHAQEQQNRNDASEVHIGHKSTAVRIAIQRILAGPAWVTFPISRYSKSLTICAQALCSPANGRFGIVDSPNSSGALHLLSRAAMADLEACCFGGACRIEANRLARRS